MLYYVTIAECHVSRFAGDVVVIFFSRSQYNMPVVAPEKSVSDLPANFLWISCISSERSDCATHSLLHVDMDVIVCVLLRHITHTPEVDY